MQQRPRESPVSQSDSHIELKALELLERALSETSDARAAFIENALSYSQAVRARAQTLLAGDQGPAYLQTNGVNAFTLALAEPPDRIGAYRIIKEIGRGGMGAVYEAERDQGDFERQVAIKIIATSKVSDKLIARFTQERQILAKLTDPYIARLYDGGETDDGLPYLVMELVDGEPLKAWLETQPSLASCFAVLTKILSAVEYAHSALVIHRDLTPSNVIVTEGDGVKIIDFGISSFPSPHSEAFISGQTATPGFAPPEGSDGDAQSTTIDIYALGKLIRLMFHRFDQPDLMAIADKAAADDPQTRYGTVSQLAEDVQRYRAGYPIKAYGHRRFYTAKKYVRRNWLGLSIAGSVLCGAAVGVGMIAKAYQQEQTALKLAASRFEAVRALARFQLFDMYDAINAIPNTVEARQMIARSSISYLNALALTPDAPPDLRREVGEGWLRLSRVTGGAGGDHIGQPEEAITFGERALTILEDLYQDYPNDPDAQLALGNALGLLAFDSLYMHGDSAAGYARATRAVEVLTGISVEDAPAASAVARAYRALGDAYGWQNKLEQAGKAYDQGLTFVQSLPNEIQQSITVVIATSPLMRQLAEVYRYTGEPDKALSQLRSTVAYLDAAVARASSSEASVLQRNLTIILWNVADMHRSLAQWDDGLRYAMRGKSIIDRAMALNPKDFGWLEIRPQTLSVLAQLESGLSNHAKAVSAADGALEDLRALRARTGANAGSDLKFAVALKEVAEVYRRAEQENAACDGLRQARDIFETYEAAGDLSTYDRENNLAPVRAALKQC